MADSPKEAEAAQALFCAMADFVGKKDIDKVFDLKKLNKTKANPNFTGEKLYDIWKASNFTQVGQPKKNMSGSSLIQEALTYLDTPSVSLQQIEKFLQSDSWFESSLLTAKKIIKDLATIVDRDFKKLEGPGWQNIFYIRGAKADKSRAANTMENVEALFKIANKNNPQFGDVNKWSPADIYFVTSNAASTVARQIYTLSIKSKKGSATKQSIFGFDELNKLVNDLIESGDMLPLSLKKVAGTANLVTYNFVRSKEEEYFSSILFDSVSKRTPYRASFGTYKNKLHKKYPVTPVTRDIKIYFSPSQKEKIKIRHDLSHPKFGASKSIKVEIEVTGAGGRGGSFVGMDRLVDIIASVDFVFGKNLDKAWKTGLTSFETEIENLNKKYGVAKGDSHSVLKNQAIAITNEWDIKNNKTREPFNGQNMYEQYKIERIHIAGVEIDNKIYPVIQGYFDSNDNKDNIDFNSKIIQKFIEYASSRSENSGQFVIAK